MRFDQFDPVAERILHMPALAAFDGLVFILDVVAGTPGFFENVSQVVDNESRVCLARRDKILVDSGRTCTWWATLTARLGLSLNLRCAPGCPLATSNDAACSRNALTLPEILHATREPDVVSDYISQRTWGMEAPSADRRTAR